MIILLENDEITAGQIRGVLRGDVETIPTAVEVKRRLETVPAHTVVLGPTVPEGSALELARSVRVSHPAVGVIVLRPRLDTATLTDVMRSGARDALAAHEIDKLSDRVAASEMTTRAILGEDVSSSVGRKSARVITVFSPKGGCGKTTLSTNLACALAQDGHKVALLDFDVAFGDVAIAMGLQPRNTLGEAVAMSGRLDDAAIRGLLTRHPSGVQVLAAPTNPTDSELITAGLMHRVLEVTAESFDFVVVDTAPVMDERNLRVLEQSDQVLVVTTLDVAAMKNVKVSLDTLRMLAFPMAAVGVVLNRADAKVGLDPDQVPSLVKGNVVAKLPSSRDVPESTNHGQVLVHSRPKHAVSTAVRALATAQTAGRAEAPVPTKITVQTTEKTRRMAWRLGRTTA